VDLRRDGRRRRTRLRRAVGDRTDPGAPPRGDRARCDDVPAAGEGELLAAPDGLSQLAGARPEPRPELAHRADPDVRTGCRLLQRARARSSGPSRVLSRTHLHRDGPVYRDGARLERTRGGVDRVCDWTGRVQQPLPDRHLRRLRLVLRALLAPLLGMETLVAGITTFDVSPVQVFEAIVIFLGIPSPAASSLATSELGPKARSGTTIRSCRRSIR